MIINTAFRGQPAPAIYKKEIAEQRVAAKSNSMEEQLNIYQYIGSDKQERPAPEKKEILSNGKIKSKENTDETFFKKSLLPLVISPLLLFATTALITGAYKKSIAVNKNIKKAGSEGIPAIARQVALNDDNEMGLYMMVENPNVKTYFGSLAIFAGTAFTFMSKSFVEGMKEVWVNKEYARIKKHQQKEMIDIESKSFEKRYDNLYNLMSKTKNDLEQADLQSELKSNKQISLGFADKSILNKKNNKTISFGENNKPDSDKKNIKNKLNEIGFFAVGAAVLLGSFFLARKTFNNAVDITKSNLKSVREPLINPTTKKQRAVFAPADAMWGSKEGTSPTSVVTEKTAWLHTYIMSMGTPTEKLAGTLFGLLSSLGAITFIGKTTVDGVKEVKVKEENTKTEIQLHRELVDVEVKNYEAKKKKFIKPFVSGYENFLKINPTNEQKNNMKNKIMEKIELGPPYIWD